MKRRVTIGLKIGLFIPTMRIHPQVQPKAVSPPQLVTEGEAPTLPGPLEVGWQEEGTACAQEAVCPVFGRYGKQRMLM